jgi:trehalose-6-phosphate synthase
MDKAERVRRWEALMHGVVTEDVAGWRDGFVAALQA